MKRILSLAAGLVLTCSGVMAQSLSADVKQQITNRLNQELTTQRIAVGKAKLDSVAVEKKVVKLFLNDNFSYVPFRQENVAALYQDIQALLPQELKKHKLELHANNRLIEQLIPAYLRNGKSKEKTWAPTASQPLVKPVDRGFTPTAGLQDRHIAMWQSHGYYFEQKLNRWEWQRARILQTVEDVYTQGYVVPFLVPMLENAGANVMMPRERDINYEEVIVDNDGGLSCGSYIESNGSQSWSQGTGQGFAHHKEVYTDWTNPFQEGTYRQVATVTTKKGTASVATWSPKIPVTQDYAVYVAYQSLPNSADDALYTVNHEGGSTRFRVNQQMGGGTWIYLGTFKFKRGQQNSITLSNVSAKAGKVITADGVKIGGGMGNIARSLNLEGTTENLKSSSAAANNGGAGQTAQLMAYEPDYQISGYPRFTEGSRYWLQWAGAPDSVYSESHGKNDYTDDYKSRGLWVNWLAGGSQALPKQQGLHIPLDMSMAFHTDAGTTLNDSIIGTLMIYMTKTQDRETYANGASRYLAHDLGDLIQSQIVKDVRAKHAPEWSRRGLWNSSYYEARVPEVPAVLLEFLSHQNFADMRYGLDPRFRFTVSRAIYKGILQFISSQRGTPYVVQPLPVDHFQVTLAEGNTAVLKWNPVADALEPTAAAEQYLIYTRVEDGGWDNGVLVNEPTYSAPLETGKIYSWKVAAVNKGGKSFDSEILSAGLVEGEKPVLVINGFDRVSAPADFVAPGEGGKQLAGFQDDVDHGVPYLKDISYIGQMKEFRRPIPWMDDDASGFGDSYADYETRYLAGNTFDYPSVHGAALMANRKSFVSCSNEAVESGDVKLDDYALIDLILGKQYQSKMGKGGSFPLEFKTFTPALQQALTTYLQEHKGKLFVSGAYVASDLWDNPLAEKQEADVKFATQVLKYQWRVNQAARHSGLKTVQSALSLAGQKFDYSDTLNEDCYVVEAPDALEPACPEAQTVLRYTENNLSAAVAYKGDYATYILGVPFETILTAPARKALMKIVLNTLK